MLEAGSQLTGALHVKPVYFIRPTRLSAIMIHAQDVVLICSLQKDNNNNHLICKVYTIGSLHFGYHFPLMFKPPYQLSLVAPAGLGERGRVWMEAEV